jgi:hypothetical protein
VIKVAEMYKPEKIKVKGERVEICILNLTYKFMKANAYQQANYSNEPIVEYALKSAKFVDRSYKLRVCFRSFNFIQEMHDTSFGLTPGTMNELHLS